VAFWYQAKPQRRIIWLNLALVMAGLIVVYKLGQLQLLQHAKYSTAATAGQSRKFTVPAKRGQIYVWDGEQKTPLALNETLKLIYADPTEITDKADTATKLAAVTGDNPSEYLKELGKSGNYVVLKRRVKLELAEKVEALHLTGIGLNDQQFRVYPEGSLASQLLGFVNADGEGQYGLEGYLNQDLAGTPGLLKIKTDTFGNPIAIANNFEQPAVDGKDYVLTIDRNIQSQVEKYLKAGVEAVKARSGSVVIVDPNTGAVKAMANFPTYDSNAYSTVSDYSVFGNDVVSSQFEPGSGFKVITMATGLTSGKVKPETTYEDTGVVELDGRVIRNSENHKYGQQNMIDVIQKSLNTGVIFVLKALGGDPNAITLAGKKNLYDSIKRFGFGATTGIEQPSEVAGAINPPTTKSGNNVNYANMTFGQGISVNMLQMTMAVAAIANGGKLYQPHLVDQIIGADGSVQQVEPKVVRDQLVTPEISKQLTNMMVQVVEKGSGYLTKIKGYPVAGKTGTAQIPRADGQGYEETKNIGSFVGYAPAYDPRFVMMVRINEPQVSGFAESTTVPVFANIANWLLRYWQVPPS
jgi:cell division protein FtsI/penicillin-binding protein 2